MRKLGLLTEMIVGVMGVLLSSSLDAQASAKDERATRTRYRNPA